MKRRNSSQICFPMPRRATTLSEVLVSLLVMSIGVVSLITLFPISVLRSAQATHLTNSANLRYNVEALLGARPELYAIGRNWIASGSYAVGDLVTPTELTSVKSPPVVFRCTQAGTAGQFEPDWDFRNGNITADGTAEWTTYRVRNYVIDPLGAFLVESGYRQTVNPVAGDYYFGHDGGVNTARTLIRAFAGGAGNEIAADDLATLPDSWINQVESDSVVLTGPASCDLGGLQDFITPVAASFPASRIVMFDITGKVSHMRRITSTSGTVVNNQSVNWTTALPSGFVPVKARVDTKERRYTWLLSVRRSFGGASLMDVVVFFKRPFSGKDEQLYPATFQTGAIDLANSDAANDRWSNFVTDPGLDGQAGVAGINDDGNGVTDTLANGSPDPAELGWPGSDDSPRNWLVIQYDSTGEKPFIKKGGYVTDAENLRWYRILDYHEGPTPTAVMQKAGLDTSLTAYTPDAQYDTTYRSIFIRVENKILQNGTQPSGGAGGVPRGRAMLMRGIIDVYPIRTHLTWEN